MIYTQAICKSRVKYKVSLFAEFNRFELRLSLLQNWLLYQC